MRIGAIGPTEPGPPPSAPSSATPESEGPRFSSVLAKRMEEPRDRIELTRAAIRDTIDDLRSGNPTPFTVDAGVATAPSMSAATAYAAARTGSSSDPFGWRALATRTGDEIVGPGFGALFEAQIQQESGFDPEVAFGFRRSSAGAEGIAQLMPQYYPGVDRKDPKASLVAGAQSMRHYLAANGGDMRKALASYNAGLGTVQSLVAAHGAQWERGLPAETKQYLAAILGPAEATFTTAGASARAFGGRGPHGVLTPPLDSVDDSTFARGALALLGSAGATVRAPADGRVTGIASREDGILALQLDHGNGWRTTLEGLATTELAAGALVRRGQGIGALPLDGPRALRLGLNREGETVDPRPYVLGL